MAGARIRISKRLSGFTIDWSDDTRGLAGLSQGQSRPFMSSAAYRSAHPNHSPAVVWLNLSSRADIDSLNERWSAGGARIALAPEAKPWSLYEFSANDLDGNVLRVFYDFAWQRAGAKGPSRLGPGAKMPLRAF